MTGIAYAVSGTMAAAMLHESPSITIGNSGTSFGFSQGAYGSASSSSLHGFTFNVINSTSTYDFGINLTLAGAPRALFDHVKVQDTSGTVRTYRQQDASFTAGISTWTWGTGSNKAWTATSPSPRTVTFFY